MRDRNENVFAVGFRVGDLDLPEKKNSCTCSRAEEEEGAQSRPGGNADGSREIMCSVQVGTECVRGRDEGNRQM